MRAIRGPIGLGLGESARLLGSTAITHLYLHLDGSLGGAMDR